MPQKFDLQPYQEFDLQPYEEEDDSYLGKWEKSWINKPISHEIYR